MESTKIRPTVPRTVMASKTKCLLGGTKTYAGEMTPSTSASCRICVTEPILPKDMIYIEVKLNCKCLPFTKKKLYTKIFVLYLVWTECNSGIVKSFQEMLSGLLHFGVFKRFLFIYLFVYLLICLTEREHAPAQAVGSSR